MWLHPLTEEYNFRKYDLRNILAEQKKKRAQLLMAYRNKLAMGNRPISDESDEWEITVGYWGGGAQASTGS